MTVALEHVGAERGLLILPQGDELWIEAEATTGRERRRGPHSAEPRRPAELPESVLHYVVRDPGKRACWTMPRRRARSRRMSTSSSNRPRSRAVPAPGQASQAGRRTVLENSLTPHAFTSARMAVLYIAGVAGRDLAGECRPLRRLEAHRSISGRSAAAQPHGKLGVGSVDEQDTAVGRAPADVRFHARSTGHYRTNWHWIRLHPEDRHVSKDIVEEAVQRARGFRLRVPHRHARRIDQAYAQPGAAMSSTRSAGADEYIGTIMDITERKRDEEEMRKLVSLIENSTDFIGYAHRHRADWLSSTRLDGDWSASIRMKIYQNIR